MSRLKHFPLTKSPSESLTQFKVNSHFCSPNVLYHNCMTNTTPLTETISIKAKIEKETRLSEHDQMQINFKQTFYIIHVRVPLLKAHKRFHFNEQDGHKTSLPNDRILNWRFRIRSFGRRDKSYIRTFLKRNILIHRPKNKIVLASSKIARKFLPQLTKWPQQK